MLEDAEVEERADHVMPMEQRTSQQVDLPITSDFSPAQSKLFASKKKYQHVFRESLPHFSSNTTNESTETQ